MSEAPETGSRRRALGLLASIAPVAWLGACGFKLKQPASLAYGTLMLRGFAPRSAVGELLRARIAETGSTRVVESAPEAQLVLEALVDRSEKVVVATSTAGQVRELQLRQRFRFRVLSAVGRQLIEPTEILLLRDMSYREGLALPKEDEEALLYRAMQNDIADQVVRRLAALRAG